MFCKFVQRGVMTETDVLRKEVKLYIDKADDKALRIIKAILEIEQEEEDWWDELPTELQASIENGIKEAEEGKGTPHKDIAEKYSKWFKK